MNITVCEFRNAASLLETTWEALAAHCQKYESELVVLPEMPFHTWLPGSNKVDEALWDEAVSAHDKWMERLAELNTPVVVGSRPVRNEACKLNEGFIWTEEGGYRATHHKVYLPNEPGYWEKKWYSPGPSKFELVTVNGVKIGFLICTELWFNHHARDYMKNGMDILVCPRATEVRSRDKWVVGGQAAAVVSGAYCLSSNLAGVNEMKQEFAGTGWIIEPWDGKVLATTSSDFPFVTKEIDIEKARAAKMTYPRDVIDEF